MSEAMRISLNQCINSGGLPFKPHIKIPNEKTIKTFEDTVIASSRRLRGNLIKYPEIASSITT
ncbi:MAG: type II toxin-antitoxin system RelB/DinJ family antitoxin [Rickettsia endosymbiont of Glossina mortisans submortisans]|nr:type II toxin-antitoxin system RelB/DinJ family antitoxin [Rickettsia endosymbiont of Glossina mortisans submortisans]